MIQNYFQILLKYLKILLDTDLKIILLKQNNYVGNSSMMNNTAKNLTSSTSLSVLHNYFDDPAKLFSDLYLAKFLDISAKLFYPCVSLISHVQRFPMNDYRSRVRGTPFSFLNSGARSPEIPQSAYRRIRSCP